MNKSLDILSISDEPNETKTISNLTMDYKIIKDKFDAVKFSLNDDEILKISKHIESALEKPKHTVSDHIKILKVCNKYI